MATLAFAICSGQKISAQEMQQPPKPQTRFEHFLISSGDADWMADGSMKVRLLRPLHGVRSIRILYVDVPKTVKVVDLAIDLSVQGMSLATIQVARAFRMNENSDPQFQNYGRVHIEDTSTDAFIDTVVRSASASGSVPRMVFENRDRNYMRFEFKPVLPTLNAVQLLTRLADADPSTPDSLYIPQISAVLYGQQYAEQGLKLTSNSVLSQLRAVLLQGNVAFIRKSTLTELDYPNIAALLPNEDLLTLGGGILATGQAAANSNTSFQAMVQFAESFQNQLPEVHIAVQDVSDIVVSSVDGSVLAPLIYTINSIPAPLFDILASTAQLDAGLLFTYQWMVQAESSYPANKPAYPTAFQVADYLTGNATFDNADEAFMEGTPGRVILVPSAALVAMLPTDPVLRRMALQVLMQRSFLRTAPQVRSVQNLTTATLRATTLAFYEVDLVLDLDATTRSRLAALIYAAGGYVVDPTVPVFALQMQRDANPLIDAEFLSTVGASVQLLPFRNGLAIDSGQNFAMPFEPQSLLSATFPYSITIEAEVDV